MEKKKISYAEALAEIEAIIAGFTDGDPDIDTLASRVKRASELIAFCKERLRKAEEEVNKAFEGE